MSLVQLFGTLVKHSLGLMDRLAFRSFLHARLSLNHDIMMDRLLREFDRDNDQHLSLVEFVDGMSVYLLGTASERAALAFHCYDRLRRGHIDRQDIQVIFPFAKKSEVSPLLTVHVFFDP